MREAKTRYARYLTDEEIGILEMSSYFHNVRQSKFDNDSDFDYKKLTVTYTHQQDFTICVVSHTDTGDYYVGASKRNPEDLNDRKHGEYLALWRCWANE